MEIKLIVMDMDGTLLDADHVTVPRRNIDALRAASARGVKLAIASGRTWSLIGDTAEQLGGVDYALISNGAAVRETATGRTLWEKAIPNAQALKIIDMLHAEGIVFEVYCQGQNYVRLSEKALIRHNNLTAAFADFYESRAVFPPDLGRALAGRDVEKFNLFYVPPEKRERVLAEAMATGPLEEAQALRHNMELAAGGVNKGTALRALADQLGLAPSEVMAFGDAGNDLEMLEWAGWSFAMDNGTDQARAAARYWAPANTEAGVGQMVERYVLER